MKTIFLPFFLPPAMRYVKQLDAMRAIAILFVFCNHASPKDSFLNKVSLLISAPDVFFTISGFLITAILLKDKNAYLENKTTKATILTLFFVRRILRIFPVYYLTILITYLLNPDGVKDLKPFLTFTANFTIYTQQVWTRLAHLWSMSVEQQFYLIWPFAIVFTPQRLLPYIIGLFIAIGLISQQLIPVSEFAEVLPQTCFDALGLGALLAWFTAYKPQHFMRAYRVFSALAILSVLLMAVQVAVEIPIVNFIHHRTLISLLTVWLISYFLHNTEVEGGKIGFIFNNTYLIKFGKFSYSFYLFHITCLYYSYPLLHPLNELLPFYMYIAGSHKFYIAENLLLITGLAWLSWKYIELPVYALHKHFIPAGTKARQAEPVLPAPHPVALANAPQLTAVE